MSSLRKMLACASKIAITCISTLLIACEPLIFGGISGLGGSSSFTVTQCANGLSADLSGACRNSSPTMGALEVIGLETLPIALNVPSITQPAQSGSIISIYWTPYPGTAGGYYVYYGPTSETATTLASDLQIGIANINPSAPSISYNAMQDLGLNTGNAVCFRILAYDSAHVPYGWSDVQCTAV